MEQVNFSPSAPAVRAYLARLAGRGASVQEQALRVAAGLLWPSEGGPPGVEATPVSERPWHALSPEQTSLLREAVAAKYAPATARRVLSAVTGVVRECWRAGLLTSDARDRLLDWPPVRGDRGPAGRALAPAELQRLLDAGDVRERALVSVLALGGLRRAEAAALTPHDVTPWGPDGGPGLTLRVKGKGNRRREVFLRGIAAEYVIDHAASRGRRDSLFGLRTGVGVAPVLATLARKAGVAPFSPHDLRRTYATMALAAGADVFTVQKSMGHANPATTLRYDRRGEDDRRRLAETLSTWRTP